MNRAIVASTAIAPAYQKAIATTAEHYKVMVAFVQTQMVKDVDYGVIPGTKKPTLLKPGSEKLCRLFSLRPSYELIHFVTDFDKPLFHYWMEKKEVGVIIEGVRYIYNSFYEWVNSQFKWLSVWQFRKAMSLLRSLEIVKVIRYKAKQWNQTNYYTLDRARLLEYLKT
jgi:hypothetical protein